MRSFRQWLEAKTHRDTQRLVTVYHWDVEANFYKVLQKQGRNFPSKQTKKINRSYGGTEPRVYALWVSPNADWNDHWAAWIVRGNESVGKKTFYLHKIGLPRNLYQQYLQAARPNWDQEGQGVPELVIKQEDWSALVPLDVKAFSRKELLNKSQVNLARRAIHGADELTPGPTKNKTYHQNLQLLDPTYKRIKPRPKIWEKQNEF